MWFWTSPFALGRFATLIGYNQGLFWGGEDFGRGIFVDSFFANEVFFWRELCEAFFNFVFDSISGSHKCSVLNLFFIFENFRAI